MSKENPSAWRYIKLWFIQMTGTRPGRKAWDEGGLAFRMEYAIAAERAEDAVNQYKAIKEAEGFTDLKLESVRYYDNLLILGPSVEARVAVKKTEMEVDHERSVKDLNLLIKEVE